MHEQTLSDPRLAKTITYAASKQTYYTIRLLVDHDRKDEAFRAYAYFRWVDDLLDQDKRPRSERMTFLKRQQDLIETCFGGVLPAGMSPQECLVADLIRGEPDPESGLHAYIRNMMAVMAFDADRRGRLVSQQDLNDYTRWLAVAVTEAMHYFIGHDNASPHDSTRYSVVTGAHITHMLRDTLDDIEAGYYNIPLELVTSKGIAPWDVRSPVYRDWVIENARRARRYFAEGKAYLAQVENLRCRIAGYAYIHRFEVVLNCIEREGCILRAQYPERKALSFGIGMIGWAFWMAFLGPRLASPEDMIPGR